MPSDIGYVQRILNEFANPARLESAIATLIAVVVILAGTRIAYGLAIAVLRRALRPGDSHRPQERRAQVRTLVPLIESALRYVFYFAACVMVLDRLHFNVSALVASAGLLGVAVGFGAQSLIRDIITGFLLLFEGLIQVGDVVRIGDVAGEVERVSLRTTQVRRYSGELVTIPNGRIVQLGNLSRGFMRAIVQVGVAYEADLPRAMAIMRRAGEQWAAAHPGDVLAPPEVQGITDFGATGVTVRLVVMTTPAASVVAERDLRLHLKAAFDEHRIEMSSPQRIMHLREDAARDSTAAAEPVSASETES